jgi:hypothetical protein
MWCLNCGKRWERKVSDVALIWLWTHLPRTELAPEYAEGSGREKETNNS